MQKKSKVLIACGLAALALVATSCGKGKDAAKSGKEPVTIKYIHWDSAQIPAYQQAANDFMAKNPDIKIEISQMGWDDYWTSLQTDMAAGTAPDVFTDHLAKYMDFSSKGQLLDLEPFVKKDNLDTSIYMNKLDTLWTTQDGKRYGLPKDWDTIAIVYNKNALDKAGITHDEANNLTWNAKDGGTFEKFIAKLSVDKNGNNGLSPKFDPKNVAQYGLALNHSDDRGQGQFSPFAVANGWMYTDGLFNANYHYDDPKFIDTIQWLAKMAKKGYLASFESTQNGANSLFMAGQCATTFDGSWMIGTYTANEAFPIGFARLPTGPAGRKSMINGLGDSIWVGSKHPEEAWRWVKYLASEEAQKTVGSFGVVFPAIKSGVDNALAKYAEKKLDVSAFTDEATAKDGTFLYPIVPNGVKVTEIMSRTFDKIFLFQAEPAPALKEANKKVLELFK
jgi:multiple sugar transport system substrate-binding protein